MTQPNTQVLDYGAFGVVDPVALSEHDTATGIMYDFNYGLQLRTPKDGGNWHTTIYDSINNDLLYEFDMPPDAYWASDIKYYMPWRVVMKNGDKMFEHHMCLKDKDVNIMMAHSTLGDCIAYFASIPTFCLRHQCTVNVYVQPWFAMLYGEAVSTLNSRRFNRTRIVLMVQDSVEVATSYATYRLGLIFNDEVFKARHWQKEPYQYHGLQDQAPIILGLGRYKDDSQPGWYHSRILSNIKTRRPVKERYVCIAYSGSKQCKFWHNPTGWSKVIRFLKDSGYKVFCIDQSFRMGMPGAMQVRPEGCIDLIGDIPLSDRLQYIQHADCFIGMASGLSWMAWATGTPAVVISGFSRPEMEFDNPFRVYNPEAECTDCWGDINIPFDRHDWGWCPRVDRQLAVYDAELANTPTTAERAMINEQRTQIAAKKFICTQHISAQRVINAIEDALNWRDFGDDKA